MDISETEEVYNKIKVVISIVAEYESSVFLE